VKYSGGMKHLRLILLLVFSVGVGAETISHTFSDGSKYVGEVKGGKIHGQGTYTEKMERYLSQVALGTKPFPSSKKRAVKKKATPSNE